MKHILITTIAAVVLVVAEEGNAYALDFIKTEFKAPSGNVLRYAIMKPEKVKTEETYPLVISLHGSGGRGKNNWERNCHANVALGKSERRKQYPCYVIAPTVKKSQRWNGETLKTLFELISSLQTKHAIDPDRIYVTGQSMGGYGTFAAITLRPKLFAAAAPVCGGGRTELAKQIAQIPIWVFHGAKDPTVPVERSREMVEALKKAGGTPTYTEYPDVRHNAWTRAYEDNKFWKWLFSQYRKHGGKTKKELEAAGK
jgi:predicted peptidase